LSREKRKSGRRLLGKSTIKKEKRRSTLQTVEKENRHLGHELLSHFVDMAVKGPVKTRRGGDCVPSLRETKKKEKVARFNERGGTSGMTALASRWCNLNHEQKEETERKKKKRRRPHQREGKKRKRTYPFKSDNTGRKQQLLLRGKITLIRHKREG